MKYVRGLSWGLFVISVAVILARPGISLAQGNPCGAKPTKGRQNPCVAKNPCAAQNPCAPRGQTSGVIGKAITARGEITKVDPGSGQLVLRSEGKQIDLKASKYLVVRDGPKVKPLSAIKPGEKVTVSYIETGKDRTAWYVYLASAASVGNPCAANPCAVKNPCAAQNPCAANPCAPKAKKASQNPCSANNPCAPASKAR